MLSPPSRMCSLTATRVMSGMSPDATGSQREQAEIRGASADIDDQDVPRLGIVCVACPQRLCRTVPFQPAIEDCLRLLEEPNAAGESGFLRRIQSEPLRGGVERGGNRDSDFLVIERATDWAKRLSQAPRR